MKKKLLITSILSVIMCMSLIVGATFALFTSEDNVNVAVHSATVEVKAKVKDGSITTKSFDKIITENVSEGLFENGGTAKFDNTAKTLTLDCLTPGDEVLFVIDVENNSNVIVKYRVEMFISGELAPALVCGANINGSDYVVKNMATDWFEVQANTDINDIVVSVAFPDVADNNEYQGKSANVEFAVVAVQGNGSDKYSVSVDNANDLEKAFAMGGSIVLTDDVILNKPLTIPAETNATLDLNGNDLVLGGVNTFATTNASASVSIINNGKLEIVGKGDIENTTSAYIIENNGNLIVNVDGVFSGFGAIRSNSGSVIIEKGVFNCSSRWQDGNYQHTLKAKNTKVVINGGIFDATVNGQTNAVINVSTSSDVTINAGAFKNVDQLGQFDPYLFTYEGNGKLTINDGTFFGGWRFNGETTTTDIFGGDFTVSYDGQSFNQQSTHTLKVYGGNYTPSTLTNVNSLANKIDDFIADGYEKEDNGDGSFSVDYKNVDASDFNSAIKNGQPFTFELGEDATISSAIRNDATIDLGGKTLEATATIELKNNSDLAIFGGDYVVNNTYGHVDVRPSTTEGSTVLFENVNFAYYKLGSTYGPSTNRLGSVVEVCAIETDAKTVIVFKNCIFDNAMVVFEGLSGKTGEFEATFEDCTFNALTSSAPICVQNYVKGTLNVKGCTFNITATSSSASAISVSSSSSTEITVNAENNTINAVAATPYTFDATKGETEVHNVKVNGKPKNIKFISYLGTVSTINEVNTTKTGIAVIE
ncbi:MAG: hypothetical protein IKA85_06130 [Clostridia bacterium]|nr:hypothetical protein [Clostridia bacterium]